MTLQEFQRRQDRIIKIQIMTLSALDRSLKNEIMIMMALRFLSDSQEISDHLYECAELTAKLIGRHSRAATASLDEKEAEE